MMDEVSKVSKGKHLIINNAVNRLADRVSEIEEFIHNLQPQPTEAKAESTPSLAANPCFGVIYDCLAERIDVISNRIHAATNELANLLTG